MKNYEIKTINEAVDILTNNFQKVQQQQEVAMATLEHIANYYLRHDAGYGDDVTNENIIKMAQDALERIKKI